MLEDDPDDTARRRTKLLSLVRRMLGSGLVGLAVGVPLLVVGLTRELKAASLLGIAVTAVAALVAGGALLLGAVVLYRVQDLVNAMWFGGAFGSAGAAIWSLAEGNVPPAIILALLSVALAGVAAAKWKHSDDRSR